MYNMQVTLQKSGMVFIVANNMRNLPVFYFKFQLTEMYKDI